MAAKRIVVPPRVYTNEELERVALDLIVQASGLASNDFKKVLAGDLKKADKTVVAAALRLSARRACFRWGSAKKMRFFTEDPFDALALAVKEALSGSPLTEAELKARVEAHHRGFSDLLKEWLKGALARGEVFTHPPAKGSKLKRYGNEPNVDGLLKNVIKQLKLVLASVAGQRIAKTRLLDAIAVELGLAPGSTPATTSAREHVLLGLYELSLESSVNGLLSLRELRARLPLDKPTFDRVVLELSRDEIVTLHHHDFPTSFSDSERDELVADDRGQYYVGIALRRAS